MSLILVLVATVFGCSSAQKPKPEATESQRAARATAKPKTPKPPSVAAQRTAAAPCKALRDTESLAPIPHERVRAAIAAYRGRLRMFCSTGQGLVDFDQTLVNEFTFAYSDVERSLATADPQVAATQLAGLAQAIATQAPMVECIHSEGQCSGTFGFQDSALAQLASLGSADDVEFYRAVPGNDGGMMEQTWDYGGCVRHDFDYVAYLAGTEAKLARVQAPKYRSRLLEDRRGTISMLGGSFGDAGSKKRIFTCREKAAVRPALEQALRHLEGSRAEDASVLVEAVRGALAGISAGKIEIVSSEGQ